MIQNATTSARANKDFNGHSPLTKSKPLQCNTLISSVRTLKTLSSGSISGQKDQPASGPLTTLATVPTLGPLAIVSHGRCEDWDPKKLNFLFRPVSMTNVHHNALKIATALMVTIATNAAGKQDINKETS